MEQNDIGKVGISYVILPGQIAFNPNLTRSDMFVFWLISLFDTTKKHCFASNAYMAKKLRLSEIQIKKSIARLKDQGYIKQISFDGRKRTLAIDLGHGLCKDVPIAITCRHTLANCKGHDSNIASYVYRTWLRSYLNCITTNTG